MLPGFDAQCPGSGPFRQPEPEFFPCPHCGEQVEVWTDELQSPCPKCGTETLRPRENLCIDWCPKARECVGSEVYARLKGEQ